MVDAVEQPLGLRYFRVDPDRGFFLNGKPYPVYGVNRHQDRPREGAHLDLDQGETARLHLLLEALIRSRSSSFSFSMTSLRRSR
jgi:beta-galactosidase/beta-glucuronidase